MFYENLFELHSTIKKKAYIFFSHYFLLHFPFHLGKNGNFFWIVLNKVPNGVFPYLKKNFSAIFLNFITRKFF